MAKKRLSKKEREEFEEEEMKEGKLWAFLATFLSIIGFILVLIRKEKSDYVKFYAKQSLVIFIVSVVAGIIGWIVMWIPVLGYVIKVGLSIIVLVLWVLSWVYALSGKMKEVPLVGSYARNINL